MYTEVDIEGFYGLPRLQMGISTGSIGPIGKLNVIVGNNATGKTAILKLLYAMRKGLEEYSLDQTGNLKSAQQALHQKLFNVFMPRNNGLYDLFSATADRLKIDTEFVIDGLTFYNHLRIDINSEVEADQKFENKHVPELGTCLFIPAKEVLTIFNAITYTREQIRLPDFDDTYYDLVKALRVPVSAQEASLEINAIETHIGKIFNGKIIQKSEGGVLNFTYRVGSTNYAMTQTAEGIKKIGILSTLIKNRLLGKNTVLFIDEPEANLHPEAQRKLVRILQRISQLPGVQVFVATHSYYIVNQLHVVAMESNQMMPCVSIVANDSQEKSYEYYDLQQLMPNIPIMKEALEMQSEEMALLFNMNEKHGTNEMFSEEWN